MFPLAGDWDPGFRTKIHTSNDQRADTPDMPKHTRASKSNPEDDYYGSAAAEAARAARAVVDFWEVGQESLARREQALGNAQKPATVAAEARAQDWRASRLIAARLLAKRCSRQELDQLVADARAHKYAMSETLVASLFEVRNQKTRHRLWRRCVRQGWARRRLELEKRTVVGALSPRLKGKLVKGGRTWKFQDAAECREMLKQQMRTLRAMIAEALEKHLASNRRLPELRRRLGDAERSL